MITKDQILQTQSVLEGLRSNLADENRKLDAKKKNEHDLLKSLVDSMEGYPESVKFFITTKTGTIRRHYYRISFM